MEIQLFEDLLKKYNKENRNPQSFWDKRAKGFSENQKKSGRDSSIKVTQNLLDKGLLKDMRVLDIGGGSGRYAIPFSDYAKEVTMADVSSQMLSYAKKNAEIAGLSNIKYVHLNWGEADLVELGWKKQFDFVFASMCQGVLSREGLQKMSAASGKWCQINQLMEMTDSLSQSLMKELDISPVHDVHNNTEIPLAIFNLLWLMGFTPEISYLKESEKKKISMEEALDHYSFRFGRIAELKGIHLKCLLEKYLVRDSLPVEKKTSLAMILWKV